MPTPQSHAENRNWMEQLLRKVPGFKGYLEKEYRRESDALQRKALADRLHAAKRTLDDYGRRLVDAGQIGELGAFDRLRGKLDLLANQISSAMQGYSGVFDLVRIDESVLDNVYEFDVELQTSVELLSEAVKQLAATTSPSAEALADATARASEIERAWGERAKILKGLD